MLDAIACIECGERFTPSRRRHKICSEMCRKVRDRRRVREYEASRTPTGSVAEVRAYWRDRERAKRSRERAEQGLPDLWAERPCADCGAVFDPGPIRKGMPPGRCVPCRPVPDFQKAAEPRICATCSATFAPKLAKHRYCSKECSRKAPERTAQTNDLRRKRAAERKAAGLCPDHGNEKPCTLCWVKQQRKRSRRRAVHVEYVDIRVVAESQRWKCSQCGKAIPKSAKWPDARSLSMDHTVPVSEGGETSYRNVTAAHLSCNMAKGAKALVPEQLRLVG